MGVMFKGVDGCGWGNGGGRWGKVKDGWGNGGGGWASRRQALSAIRAQTVVL